MNNTHFLHPLTLLQQGLNAEIAFALAIAQNKLICPGITAIATGLSSPVFNYVIDTQVGEENIHDKINLVREFFHDLYLNWTWVIGPLSRPLTLDKHLEAHGLILTESYPGLFTDLSRCSKYQPLNSFSIAEAEMQNCLHEWIQPVRESFPNDDNAEGYRRLLSKIPYGPGCHFRHYVGYFEEQPVAAATLFFYQEGIMIHNICTKPAFRQRGFAYNLTHFALAQATQLGYQYCFLNTSEHGLGLYRKLGFQVYCHYHVFTDK